MDTDLILGCPFLSVACLSRWNGRQATHKQARRVDILLDNGMPAREVSPILLLHGARHLQNAMVDPKGVKA